MNGTVPFRVTELYKKKSGAESSINFLTLPIKASSKSHARRAHATLLACRGARARIQEAAQMVLIGSFFRYEKQQRGRLREHFQLNCDIIGERPLPPISSCGGSASMSSGVWVYRKGLCRPVSDRDSGPISCAKEIVSPDRWDEIAAGNR